MNCDSCENWVCLKCANMPQSLYLELQKHADESDNTALINWYCKICKGLASDMKTINTNVLELKKSNEERLNRMEDKISNLEKSVKDTVRQEVEVVRDELSNSVQKNLSETVSKLVDTRLKEMEDRKNRASNMIFFNVPSLEDPTPTVRKEHDIFMIKQLFNEIFPEETFLVTTCFRLGKKKPEDTKEPPLKVICDSKAQRRRLLQNAKSILDNKDENLKKVIVSRDLTVEQRAVSKQLRSDKPARQTMEAAEGGEAPSEK